LLNSKLAISTFQSKLNKMSAELRSWWSIPVKFRHNLLKAILHREKCLSTVMINRWYNLFRMATFG
jgi:hypothetical protein